tara:strand:+ start:94 stop:657 length:564 start_codon:yes stop_codon:yes gene_type:complete
MTTLYVIALSSLGCDVIDKAVNAPPKGSLDSVLLCMKENANKKDLIGEAFIKQECVKKHQLFANERPSKSCAAWVRVNPADTSTIELSDDCINSTGHIITSIEGEIVVKNLAGDETDTESKSTTETAHAQSSATWIKPRETLQWKTLNAEHEWPEQVTEDIPHCSKNSKEVCISWAFDGYYYLKIDI